MTSRLSVIMLAKNCLLGEDQVKWVARLNRDMRISSKKELLFVQMGVFPILRLDLCGSTLQSAQQSKRKASCHRSL